MQETTSSTQGKLDQSLFKIIENTAVELGFDLVKLSLDGQSKTLEILIDSLSDSQITIGDCRKFSKTVSVFLEAYSDITNDYHIAVSSAGVERPLFKLSDYQRFVNRDVKIKLKKSLNGASHYKGKIGKVEANIISLVIGQNEVAIDFNLIKSANLVLSDELFKKLLQGKVDGM